MRNLKGISFSKVKCVSSSGSLGRINCFLYCYPTSRRSVRLFVVCNGVLIDKIGTISYVPGSNEVFIVLNYSKLRYWLRSGIKVSYDNFDLSMRKVGFFDTLVFY